MNKGKILIVDDSFTQASKFKTILEEAGYATDIANDGVEAIDYLNSDKSLPNLILADIVMPNMDGIEL
jgi:CheY-like chemotaxis protein